MEEKKYSLKNIKYEDESKHSFSADLFKGRRKVAHLRSDGQIVNCDFEWTDEKKRIDFVEFISRQQGKDADRYIVDLLSRHERNEWVERLAERNTVFRLNTDKEDEYHIVEEAYSEGLRKSIVEEFGDNLLIIFNDKKEKEK